MDENTLLYFIKKSTEFLDKKGIPSARLEAEILIAHILKLSRIQLYAKFDMPLTTIQKDLYRKYIIQRSERIPTAYLLGTKDFYKSSFIVNESVLIPRPETEELVDLVIKYWIKAEDSFTALDLCCGSGCIGISIQKARVNGNFFYLDISPTALEVAKENFKNVLPHLPFQDKNFIESDFWNAWEGMQELDYILANPPYVLPEEESLLSEEVKKEPRLALVADDFMKMHQDLIMGAYKNLKMGGRMILETHPDKAKDLLQMGEGLGFQATIQKDLSNKDRFVIFQK